MWGQAVVVPAASVLFFTRVRVGGPQVRSIIKDEQQPSALRYAGSRMWFVLTSGSSSALLAQSFTLCPSHLGCPPYSVNYDLITTSLQIRSSSWPVVVWNRVHLIPHTHEGLTWELCMLVWVFSKLRNQLVSVVRGCREWRLLPTLSGTMLHLSARGW